MKTFTIEQKKMLLAHLNAMGDFEGSFKERDLVDIYLNGCRGMNQMTVDEVEEEWHSFLGIDLDEDPEKSPMWFVVLDMADHLKYVPTEQAAYSLAQLIKFVREQMRAENPSVAQCVDQWHKIKDWVTEYDKQQRSE